MQGSSAYFKSPYLLELPRERAELRRYCLEKIVQVHQQIRKGKGATKENGKK